MRYASTSKNAARVETYSRTVCPSAAYALSANPSIALDACAGIRHAEVPGRAFSCWTQRARMPRVPSSVAGVTLPGGGVLDVLDVPDLVGVLCVVDAALCRCAAVQPARMTATPVSATNVFIRSPSLPASAHRCARVRPGGACSPRQPTMLVG